MKIPLVLFITGLLSWYIGVHTAQHTKYPPWLDDALIGFGQICCSVAVGWGWVALWIWALT